MTRIKPVWVTKKYPFPDPYKRIGILSVFRQDMGRQRVPRNGRHLKMRILPQGQDGSFF
jgi:hypothetical protein